MKYTQITIVGTGLIGGSFALALKSRGLAQRIVGCDRAEILRQAERAGAIDAGQIDLAAACAGSELVMLATPVGAIIDLLPRIAPILGANSLVTDVGSTKREICATAERVWGRNAAQRFLPGHPMAGKAEGGVEHATAELFNNAVWLFTPLSQERTPPAQHLMDVTEKIGARPLVCDADAHDRICAYVSHLPQMMATALASLVAETDEEEGLDPNQLAGAGLRSMTRLATSPYSMWRDIALTNADNIEAALLKMEQKLAHIRENLQSPELRAEFEKARAARAVLK